MTIQLYNRQEIHPHVVGASLVDRPPTDARRGGASSDYRPRRPRSLALRPWPAQSQIGGPQRFAMNGGCP